MTSEWDNTPWAGSPVTTTRASALQPLGVRSLPIKAVSGAGLIAYANDIPLASWLYGDQQARMAAYLRAYKVGWFHKAGRRISEDIATLNWTVSDGDIESEDPQETVLGRPDLDIPFNQLTPIEQFMRLLEKPNPSYMGRVLFGKTQIRRDFAGNAFWFLEGVETEDDLPTAIYGISPARMTPSRDASGRLIGWVMDKDRPSGGIPFTAEQIIAFPMASADDDDAYGVGVVESVFAELPLGDMMARHTSDLLTTGGRLAGMLSPKDRALTADEFDDAVKAWRSVASDPNAARRLLLFPEPMEYAAGASTPAEIGIPELANLNRDNILTAFPIDPTMLGVQMPSGLNANGATRREIKEEYWRATVGTRSDALKETIQSQLVSRYERAMGQTFDFDFDIPLLDDAPSIIEKVGAFKGLVSVGFDPREAVKTVGLGHVKWLGLPTLLDPAMQAQAAAEARQAQLQAPAQDSGISVQASDTTRSDAASTQVQVAKSVNREDLTASAIRTATNALGTFFEDQRTRVIGRLRDSLPQTKAARKADTGDWWDATEEDRLLTETLRGLYLKVGTSGLQLVADQLGRVVLSTAVRNVLNDLLSYGGARITDINETTRQAIVAQLAEGTRRGYSINQLIDGVPAENYAGVTGAVLDNGTPAFDPYRAEVIARTETALSFNRSALTGYNEFGVREVQAIDGDGDEQCAARNGRTFAVADALSIEDHPNGTLDWVPVI